ncbi:hypothetical protein GCM10009530_12720 [Microbispora corallina]|uniref:Serine/threonine protein kinase n=1 Tax=Microbispora corallina TaxID=83302 RepID=A0ABQ4FTD2_9ACTN|nr:hypothetical protein [Microbispora corallina]GIH38031.1 hypothetical protein Mco01_10310 [Microbispora corallina]
MLHAILHREPDLTAVPAALAPLLARCLDKDPGLRPSAAELYRSLTGEREPRPEPSPGPSGTPVAPRTPPLPGSPASPPTAPGGASGSPASPGQAGAPATAPSPGADAPAMSGARGRRVALAAGLAVLASAAAAFVLVPSFLGGPGERGSGDRGGASASSTASAPTHTGRTADATATTAPLPPFGTAVHPQLTGHGNDVRSVAVGALNGTPIALTGSDDTTPPACGTSPGTGGRASRSPGIPRPSGRSRSGAWAATRSP